MSNKLARQQWQPLSLNSPSHLRLDVTLRCGQAFTWVKSASDPLASAQDTDGEWLGVLNGVALGLRQDPSSAVWFRVHGSIGGLQDPESQARGILSDYLHLKLDLPSLLARWSKAEKTFEDKHVQFAGLRLLRQNPVECLFSFICSQNNNISRITKMVTALSAKYGTLVCKVNDIPLYAFPTIDQLCEAKEEELRAMGFGYRARYIVEAAKQVRDKGGEPWLLSLRERPRFEVQAELLTFLGVGRKVADCVSLFSLDKLDVVPVDTHVWQIAQRYLPSLRKKSLTDSVYIEIGEFFRDRFGEHCGWAHTLMFANELSFFQKEKLAITQQLKTEETEVVQSPKKKQKK